ncbi:hypothetical protein HYT04_03015 [Candidatus Kaiserbacteria bacterium]|nr:hypothetical protein [Candidatus Kaiserbacteria bacterium]
MRRSDAVLVSLFLLLAALRLLMFFKPYFFPYPDIDTVYTREFSYANFAKVKLGMSKGQVRQLLGPSFKPIYPGNECWPYSKDGKLWPVADFAWVAIRVCFQEGRVVATNRTVFD